VPRPRFRFWIAAGQLDQGSPSLRCTVNGAALADLPATIESSTRLEASIPSAKGDNIVWKWTQVEVEATTLVDGAAASAGNAEVALADHAGAWSCAVRLAGRTLRELRFQVTDGAIASHPMQRAANAAPLAPGVALIEIRIPRDAGLDQRIKPDQLRKSRGFGLAWPSDPSVAAIHAAFPPAVEIARPVPAKVTGKAAGKLLPGVAHDPPRFVDEASTVIRLSRNADGKTDGYAFHAYALVWGTTSKTDRVRLDWKQGGKRIASAPCSVSKSEREPLGVDSCDYEGKPLTARGAIEAELIYSDESDGNDYLVRTYKVTVAKYPSFGDAVWQVVPDDVLAGAWVKHWYPLVLNDSRAGHPHFAFWVARGDDFVRTKATLRCTVDGAKLADIRLGLDAGDGGTIEAATQVQGKPVTYTWSHIDATAAVYLGKLSDYPEAENKAGVFLADHPGAWVCQMRQEGTVVRELAFTVNDKGMISSELQTAPGAAPTLRNVAAVELRFPKGAKLDTRVRPDAMKRSRGFGLPWPAAPSVKASQATFPPASGLPDPR
jgi:hypothetical protein